jgi:hypothetical protein
MRKLLALAALVALLPAPAGAQIGGPVQRQAIYDQTPSCAANPGFPVIGRVSGGTEDIDDRTIPVSFVGCFPDMPTCERWKGMASSIITTTIIQYSCRPR